MNLGRSRKLRKTPLFLAIAVSALFACDDDDNGNGTGPGTTSGTFSATVSGDLSESISGTAVWGGGTDPQTSQSGWVIALTTDAGDAVQVLHLGTESPATGTFSLIDVSTATTFDNGDTGAVVVLQEGTTIQFSGGSVSGTIEITDVDGDEIRGTFTIQANGVLDPAAGGSEADISVSGEFSATQSTNVVFPDF